MRASTAMHLPTDASSLALLYNPPDASRGTSHGKTCMSSAGRMPCNSSALVTRLLDANGIVLGKTRMHELAMGATTINPNGGPVLNPHNNIMHVGGEAAWYIA